MKKLQRKSFTSITLKRESLRAFRRAVIRMCNHYAKQNAEMFKRRNDGGSTKTAFKELQKLRKRNLSFFHSAFTESSR